MWSTRALVGGACTLRVLRVALPDVQKCPSIMLSKESSCPLFVNVVCVIGDDPIWCWLTVFLLLLSLILKNYNLIFLVVSISTSIFILSIFNFWS